MRRTSNICWCVTNHETKKKIDEAVTRMDEKRKTVDKWQSKDLWWSLLSYFVVNEPPGSKKENRSKLGNKNLTENNNNSYGNAKHTRTEKL